MKLMEIVNEMELYRKLQHELSINESEINRWSRIRKQNFGSYKLSKTISNGIDIYRGFSQPEHLENFLLGNVKPMSNIFGTGVFFSTDYDTAKSYAGSKNTILHCKIRASNTVTIAKLNAEMVTLLENYGQKYTQSDALALWNIFKDVGISSCFLGYDYVLLEDKNLIVNNFKVVSLVKII